MATGEPIYAEWTLLPQFFGQVHFLNKGYMIIFLLIQCFVDISELNANLVDLIRRRVARRLTWVYTVRQRPYLDCRSMERKCEFQIGHITFMEIDHEIICTVVLLFH